MIGKYEIIDRLGAGGMGVVFRARDERLARQVAIKFLQTSDQETTERCLVEARATAQCSHENIVIIYEVGEWNGAPFMVLEYLEGQTLGACLKKDGPLAPSRAVDLVAAIVRALDCAHERGIVHRDLKPENILITGNGTVKVLDFGIAKVLQDQHRSPAVTRPQPQVTYADDKGEADPAAFRQTAIVGTMGYMSPEQWGVGGQVDGRTDIWAVGIILYQALSGHHPLEQLAMGGELRKQVTNLATPVPSLASVSPGTPPELVAVVDRCLRKRADQRFASAAELLRALEPFLPGRWAARSGPQAIEGAPYAGLRAFQEEDAGRFFGRTRDIAALTAQIRTTPLMAAVGPSGIGKSSLIRAGVAPALKASGEDWQVMVARPGRDPMLALAGLLAPLTTTSPTLMDDLGAQKELAARLGQEPGHLGSVLRGVARRTGQRLLLFIDQFEELYTQGAGQPSREAFTACLTGAADDATSPVRVVISIRADFLGRVTEDPRFMKELAGGLYVLRAPTTDGLREAIVQPAEMAGYRFETPSIVEEMIQHLEATPGALPLLQFAAAQLWEARDARRKLLTMASYRELGGISGALVRHADRVIAKLDAGVQALARSLLVHLVTPERTRAVRHIDELDEMCGKRPEFGRLVDDLVESRLLVVQTGGGAASATVEIVHESLIASWPALRGWLEDTHEDSVFLEQLQTAARQWQAKKRDPGLLWGGDMVDELALFQRRHRGDVGEAARPFIEAIFAQRARGVRRRRRLAVAGVTLSVTLLAAAGIALVIVRNAQTAAERNATVARRAEGDAQRRLHEVQEKERQRREAQEKEQIAEGQKQRADEEVRLKNLELESNNAALKEALAKAEEERRQAEAARAQAKKNEEEAVAAQKKADESREAARASERRARELARQEQERVATLEAQLGAAVEDIR